MSNFVLWGFPNPLDIVAPLVLVEFYQNVFIVGFFLGDGMLGCDR
jgi:hypothetical protein